MSLLIGAGLLSGFDYSVDTGAPDNPSTSEKKPLPPMGPIPFLGSSKEGATAAATLDKNSSASKGIDDQSGNSGQPNKTNQANKDELPNKQSTTSQFEGPGNEVSTQNGNQEDIVRGY